MSHYRPKSMLFLNPFGISSDRSEAAGLIAAMFEVAAASYDRFMGRYSTQLSPQLADLAGVDPGQRVLDVGCGPGVLTGELVARVGSPNVPAAVPSETFVAATRHRSRTLTMSSGSRRESLA